MSGPVLHVYPYRDEGDPPVPRPTVDIHLEFGETGQWTTRALIDSGSPITVFDGATAEALTIRLGQSGARTGSVALLGARRAIQVEYVHLCLPDYPEYQWETEVAFITDLGFQMPFQGILGSRGFLDRFAVTLDYYNTRFIVEQPAEWTERVGRHLLNDPSAGYDPQWSPPG